MRGSELHFGPADSRFRTCMIRKGEDQWGLLSEVFVAKSKASLEYEAKKMVEEICNKTSWQP